MHSTRTDTDHAPRRGGSATPFLIAVGIVLILLSLGGYLFLKRLQSVEESMARVEQEVERFGSEVQEVSRTAAQARSAAEQAEEFARIAAEGRDVAEASRDAYLRRLEEAEQEVNTAHQTAEEAQAELERFRKERAEEMNRLQRALNRIAETRRTSLGLMMNLGSDTVKFDFDQATLKPEYRELLSRIAGVLLTSDGYRVQIYGHTDDVGTVDYNQQLSERRAETVMNYLIEAGIEPEIISTKGFGKSNPLVPSSNPDARAKNRRVEIGIIDTLVSYEGPVPPEREESGN